MYKLIKITNAGCNVPEPMRLSLKNDTVCDRGVPFYLSDGTFTPVTSGTKRLPTHMTICESDGKDVLCYEITSQMVFAVKAEGSPADMTVGSEYLLSANGTAVSLTKATGDLRGALLLSKNGASKAGDEILVAFR